jgi:hypothetical protein
MDSRHLLSSSVRHRLGKVAVAIAFVIIAGYTGGLAGLLLLMAALMLVGTAIANVKILRGARETWRSCHVIDNASPTRPTHDA